MWLVFGVVLLKLWLMLRSSAACLVTDRCSAEMKVLAPLWWVLSSAGVLVAVLVYLHLGSRSVMVQLV